MRNACSRFFLVSLVCVVMLSAAAISTFPATPTYVGSSKCRVCHLPQYKTWQQTKMSKAYELLKPGVSAEAKTRAKLDPKKDYTQDATCLACHTTGYGQAGGFRDLASTPDLAGIGCEACHGPGSEYLKPNRMTLQNKEYKRAEIAAAGLVIPNKQTCAACHNAQSPFVQPGAPFDFEARKNQGTHQHIPLKFKH